MEMIHACNPWKYLVYADVIVVYIYLGTSESFVQSGMLFTDINVINAVYTADNQTRVNLTCAKILIAKIQRQNKECCVNYRMNHAMNDGDDMEWVLLYIHDMEWVCLILMVTNSFTLVQADHCFPCKFTAWMTRIFPYIKSYNSFDCHVRCFFVVVVLYEACFFYIPLFSHLVCLWLSRNCCNNISWTELDKRWCGEYFFFVTYFGM